MWQTIENNTNFGTESYFSHNLTTLPISYHQSDIWLNHWINELLPIIPMFPYSAAQDKVLNLRLLSNKRRNSNERQDGGFSGSKTLSSRKNDSNHNKDAWIRKAMISVLEREQTLQEASFQLNTQAFDHLATKSHIIHDSVEAFIVHMPTGAHSNSPFDCHSSK